MNLTVVLQGRRADPTKTGQLRSFVTAVYRLRRELSGFPSLCVDDD